MKRLVWTLMPLCAVILTLAAVKPASAGKPKVIGIVSIDGLGSFPALSYAWNIQNTGTTNAGSGGGAGKAEVADLTVTKPVDGLTPELFLACAKGQHITTIRLDLYGPGSKLTLSVIMSDVLVTALKHANAGVVDETTEAIVFNFGRVLVVHGGSSAGWDITANKAV